MYKSVFTVLIAVTMAALSSWGQRQDDPVIKSVQKAYAQAEAQIAKGEEEQQDLNMMTVNVDQMWPGSGRHTETIKFYFTLDNSEEDFTNTLYLVRKTSRVAVREFLEEYLYDTQEAGKPLLCILTYYTDEGEKQQLRLYFKNGKPYQQVPLEAPTEMQPDYIMKSFENYFSAFRRLINH